MKSVTAKVMLVLVICATPTRAQDDSLGTRQTLADAGYRYDDPASLMRALEDENGLVAVIATNYLAQQRATPDIIAALRAASGSPRESVAASAFGALQKLGATGWEGSAIGLLQGTRDHTIRLPLARVLAQAGSERGLVHRSGCADAGRPVHGSGVVERGSVPRSEVGRWHPDRRPFRAQTAARRTEAAGGPRKPVKSRSTSSRPIAGVGAGGADRVRVHLAVRHEPLTRRPGG